MTSSLSLPYYREEPLPCSTVCYTNMSTTRSQALKGSAKADNACETIVRDVLKELIASKEFEQTLTKCVEKAIEKHLEKIIEEQERQKGTIFDLELQLDKKEEELNNMKTLMQGMTTSLEKLKADVNSLEQYSRRNCLRIFGVVESDGENTSELVMELARNNLQVNIEQSDIDRSHRIGRSHERGHPRDIIVKFTSYRVRDMVIKNRKKLKGTKIVIKEDLTRANHNLLRSTITHPSVSSAWSKDGVIFALTKKEGADVVTRVGKQDDLKEL